MKRSSVSNILVNTQNKVPPHVSWNNQSGKLITLSAGKAGEQENIPFNDDKNATNGKNNWEDNLVISYKTKYTLTIWMQAIGCIDFT